MTPKQKAARGRNPRAASNTRSKVREQFTRSENARKPHHPGLVILEQMFGPGGGGEP